MLPAVGVAGPDSSISTEQHAAVHRPTRHPTEKVTMEYRWLRTKKQVHWAPPGPFPVTMSVYANPGTNTSSGQCYTAQAGHSLAKASPRWKPASPNETVTLFTAALMAPRSCGSSCRIPRSEQKVLSFTFCGLQILHGVKLGTSTTTIFSRKNKQRIQGRQ